MNKCIFIFLLSSFTTILIAQKKYLFITDEIINKSYAVNLEYYQPTKYEKNPIIIADKEWEEGVNCFGTVMYDEGKYRMWYQIYNEKEKNDTRLKFTVGYAESKDGINWSKPELGIINYKGNKNNNIVLTSYGKSDLYSPAIIKIDKTTDNKKYKMFYWDCMSDENLKKYGDPNPIGKTIPGWTAIPGEGLFAAFSNDGINWEKYGTQPLFNCPCDASTVMKINDSTYQAFFKISTAADRHFRIIGTSVSKDFVNWSTPKIILEPDHNDNYGTEFYGMSVTKYYNNYIGLLWIYNNSPSDKLMNIQLAISDDGNNWKRPKNRKTFMDTGQSGEWDAGGIVVASEMLIAPPEFKDKILIYYGGSTVRHDDSRRLHRENSIGLATLRLDGFSAMTAKFFEGYFTTIPVKPDNVNMYINAEANKGYIEIELIDPITNKTINKSKRIENNDSTKIGIEWINKMKLDNNKYYIFKFNMKKAKLFSFWFE